MSSSKALLDLDKTQPNLVTKLLKTGWVMMSTPIRGRSISSSNVFNYTMLGGCCFFFFIRLFFPLNLQWRRLQWEPGKPLRRVWQHSDTREERRWLHQQCHVFYLFSRSHVFEWVVLFDVFFFSCHMFLCDFSQGWNSFTVGASKFASIAKDNVSLYLLYNIFLQLYIWDSFTIKTFFLILPLYRQLNLQTKQL